jgi:hypothetical protein
MEFTFECFTISVSGPHKAHHMSHTQSRGLDVELQHLSMIQAGFVALLREIEQDQATVVSPSVRVALGSLEAIATAGINAARFSQDQIRASSSQASH